LINIKVSGDYMHVSGRTERVWDKTENNYREIHCSQSEIEAEDRTGNISATIGDAHTYNRPIRREE
jgi:hypothetical protein